MAEPPKTSTETAPDPDSDIPRVGDRYALVDELGRGGQAITWKARDEQTGQTVAVKELRLTTVPDWKSLELFEREAETLESLDHPNIPAYVDHLHVEDEEAKETKFYLVQEFVDGRNFEQLLEDGEVFLPGDVVGFMERLLRVVAYLHNHSPPVVHRDIKPSNILRSPDGSVALVDFGAVQTVAPPTAGGSTIIGTTGYLPIEQLMGRAQPASDVYAVGATAVHLLTGTHPAELDVERNRLKFRDAATIPDPLADVLETMTAPAAEDRFADATETLEALQDRHASTPELSISDTSEATRGTSTADGGDEQRIAPRSGPAPPRLADSSGDAGTDAPILAFETAPDWLDIRDTDALTRRFRIRTGGQAVLSRKNYLEADPNTLRVVSRPHSLLMTTAISAPILPFAFCGLTATVGPMLVGADGGIILGLSTVVFILVTIVSMAFAFNAATRVESPHKLEFTDGDVRLEAGFVSPQTLLNRPASEVQGFEADEDTVTLVTDDYHREPILFGLSEGQNTWVAEALNQWLEKTA